MTRRIHRPPVRPPSWRRLGWQEAPGALPPIAIPGAAIAAPGTVADNLRSYTVGIVAVKGRLVAYTSDRYMAVGDGCVHHSGGSSAAEAKRAAIQEHQTRCVRGAGT